MHNQVVLYKESDLWMIKEAHNIFKYIGAKTMLVSRSAGNKKQKNCQILERLKSSCLLVIWKIIKWWMWSLCNIITDLYIMFKIARNEIM